MSRRPAGSVPARGRTPAALFAGGGARNRIGGSQLGRAQRDSDARGRRPRMKEVSVLQINGERLWAALQRGGEIGRFRGSGVRRVALVPEDKQVRDLIVAWAGEAGCTVEIDAVGNLFARRPG